MADETVLTQGTELFLIDTISESNPQIVKMNCPTGITGIGGGSAAQIPTTCLGNLEGETTRPGLNQVSTGSVPFNFKPTAFSHRTLFAMKRSKKTFRWMVSLSDGTAQPTLDVDGNFVAPAGRTSIEFDAPVDTVTIDLATNEIVRGSLSLLIQPEGQIEHWNGEPVSDEDIID